jgi:hypothetical protein
MNSHRRDSRERRLRLPLPLFDTNHHFVGAALRGRPPSIDAHLYRCAPYIDAHLYRCLPLSMLTSVECIITIRTATRGARGGTPLQYGARITFYGLASSRKAKERRRERGQRCFGDALCCQTLCLLLLEGQPLLKLRKGFDIEENLESTGLLDTEKELQVDTRSVGQRCTQRHRAS